MSEEWGAAEEVLPKVPHDADTDVIKLHYHDITSADVTSLEVVVRDGWYNAFTDLAIWKDMYWLSYRRGTGHGAGNSVEVVLRSNDLKRWRVVPGSHRRYRTEEECQVLTERNRDDISGQEVIDLKRGQTLFTGAFRRRGWKSV